jgi:Leucine-rich repeat (LRR) protein
MDNLSTLINLKNLNLSCNKIKVISGLQNLHNLEKLNLSHNKIYSIAGLKQLSGNNYKLKQLDLRNNKIKDLKELTSISNLSSLNEVTFENGKNSNPCCQNKILYYKTLANISNFNTII